MSVMVFVVRNKELNMKLKYLSRKTYNPEVIAEWVKPKGFDLAITCIKDLTFNLSINLVFGDFHEFKKFIKNEYELDLEHDNARAYALRFSKPECDWNYLLISDLDWRAQDYGTIAHEVHHMTHFALKDKGLTHSSDSEESFAHFQGFLMEMIIRAFVEYKKIKKSKKKFKDLSKSK